MILLYFISAVILSGMTERSEGSAMFDLKVLSLTGWLVAASQLQLL